MKCEKYLKYIAILEEFERNGGKHQSTAPSTKNTQSNIMVVSLVK
jgi:hypothetical protein